MRNIAGSGSESESIVQRHGSADLDPDPDPHRNAMDPQKCNYILMFRFRIRILIFDTKNGFGGEIKLT
jgi:hypothetical protein